ncbi:MAG: hypothetical protein U9O86_06150, partial [Campylobacterota bacterium]|nr:hypothetical protein [Campylobacterota bacterium]
MKKLTLIFLLLVASLNADELSDAYQKEYTFLKAQKSELQNRLKKEQKFQKRELAKAKAKVQNLQNNLVTLTQKEQKVQKSIEKSLVMLDDKNSNKQISSSVVIQAKSMLSDYGITVNDAKDMDVVVVMKKAFDDTSALYAKLSGVSTSKGKFYLVDGTTAEGDIIKVGNVAAYGMSPKGNGALAPAGNGEYKLWNKDTTADASAFASSQVKRDVKIFIYENLDKDIEYVKEKTIEDTLEGG